MRRLTLLLLVLVAVGLADAEPAHACSCAAVPEPSAFASAEVVFLGEVVDFDGPRRATGDLVRWTFEVQEVYKGDVAARQEIVSSELARSCGPWFTPDVAAYVFAGSPTEVPLGEDQYYVGACGPSRIAATGPLDVDVVGQPPRTVPLAPPPTSGGPTSPAAIVAAVLVVAAVALGLLWSRAET